ncbi:hypothetical protein [Anaerocellum danielii]|uniref:Uncharacterized protein n=1 Tax=Anaerocellum danielii TaxID=1387557 RepID=A0ABZ0U3U9_9FIRM|nr:hypothetical protein [Caldicellulosiruptor danielii]WPX09737.1 hypothetical protein SOJ16_000976 [Caldicellulosiruptor danielii]
MIKKIKTGRGKQLLSSILLVGVVYLLSPITVSYDKLSANRLLLWLFALQIFVYFGVVITVSFVLKVLKVKYSQKVCFFIFSLCLNDMLVLTMLLTTLHIMFMLSVVNTIGVSYKWIIKGINFSIVLSVVDIVIVIVYFLKLYKNSYPINFLNALLKGLKRDLQENNKEKVDEKFIILKEILKSYPFQFNYNLLEPIFANDEALRILSQVKNKDNNLAGIFELIVSLFFHLLNSHELKSAYKIFGIILEYSNNIHLKRMMRFLIYEGVEKRKIFYLIKWIERGKSEDYFALKPQLFNKYLITIGFCRPSKKWARKAVYRKHNRINKITE